MGSAVHLPGCCSGPSRQMALAPLGVRVGTVDGTYMLVRDWSKATQSAPLPPFYLWNLTLSSAGDMQPPPDLTKPSTFGDLISEETLAGQNTRPPSEKLFFSHFIVKLDAGIVGTGGPYFDPSYGVSYADNSAFETQAIRGYSLPSQVGVGYPVRKPGPGAGVCADPRLTLPACVNIKSFIP
jgi:hypothetical protein